MGQQLPRVTNVLATRAVSQEFNEVAKALHIRPAQLVQLAFPPTARRNDSKIVASLHLRHFRALRLPALVEFETPPQGLGAMIHLRWRARYLPRFFPVMEADIGVRPLAGRSVELVLTGSYSPPFGVLGMIGDGIVGASAATSTAEQFLVHLAAAVEEDARRSVETPWLQEGRDRANVN